MSSWYGVDLDGTLAEYHGPSSGKIGRPVHAEVARVRRMLDSGTEVRIFTARVSSKLDYTTRAYQTFLIRQFCIEVFGRPLEVTAEKDFEMIGMDDDRATTIETNTGRVRTTT